MVHTFSDGCQGDLVFCIPQILLSSFLNSRILRILGFGALHLCRLQSVVALWATLLVLLYLLIEPIVDAGRVEEVAARRDSLDCLAFSESLDADDALGCAKLIDVCSERYGLNCIEEVLHGILADLSHLPPQCLFIVTVRLILRAWVVGSASALPPCLRLATLLQLPQDFAKPL